MKSLFSVLLLMVGSLLTSHLAALEIYWIDSEGGGSTLIVTPAGESVLVDTGNPGGRDPQRIHHIATTQAGLKRLDHVVITHFHGDHFGGLAELAELIPVGTLYDKGIPEGSPDGKSQDMRWTLLRRPYEAAHVGKRVTLAAGEDVSLKQKEGSPPLRLHCLGANQKFIQAPEGAPRNPLTGTVPAKAEDLSDNANSIVLLLEFGEFRFFDGGDLTWNVEERLVSPVNLVGTVDLYQVNHHGLESSNNPLLIRSLDPTVAVMNNGPRKGTGPSTLAALRSASHLQALYQIHENVRDDRANTDNRSLIANLGDLGDDCAAHFIKCRVSADGSAYTLEVPSQKHTRIFTTRAK